MNFFVIIFTGEFGEESSLINPFAETLKIEGKINAQFPDKWLPLYAMVTYTHLPYAQALATGKRQDKIMRKLMKHIRHESDYDRPEVQALLQKYLNSEVPPLNS